MTKIPSFFDIWGPFVAKQNVQERLDLALYLRDIAEYHLGSNTNDETNGYWRSEIRTINATIERIFHVVD